MWQGQEQSVLCALGYPELVLPFGTADIGAVGLIIPVDAGYPPARVNYKGSFAHTILKNLEHQVT